MAYRLFSLLGLSLCSVSQLELPSALVVPGWVTEPQLIGTDGGAMTTYGGAVTATCLRLDLFSKTKRKGVTEACNVVGTTAVNCEISNGTTAYDTMGPISTVVLAVKTQLSQASQTSSSTAPSALSSLSPKPSPTSTAPTSTATTSLLPSLLKMPRNHSNPPTYNDNSVPSSAIRRSRLSLESGGGRSRSEKRERKRATNGHADWGMMANLQQRIG
ncbi:hypothetical protein BT96DRAFT_979268 [Gymnopus androsaceus JB14]|uniref:Uncharacterized protein n=1 Tax=Gymnopus androsaceus JB14 TaxID=1447944 RepID=A0A6A4H4Y0_9AGAR|nr:hypothetical protein BT96DRAFT_979268 [Gymnopus androsaceus JB14]